MTEKELLDNLAETEKEYEFSQEVKDAITRLHERKPMPVVNYDVYEF